MSIIPDDLNVGDYVCVSMTFEVMNVDRDDDSILTPDSRWLFLDTGGKTTVEKVQKPFQPPASGALFVSDKSGHAIYSSLGPEGYGFVRDERGNLFAGPPRALINRWDESDQEWRNGITVIAEAAA